jgi:hypothetical protein
VILAVRSFATAIVQQPDCWVEQVLARGAKRWTLATWSIRLYYFAFLYICVSTLPLWNEYRARPAIAPQWPVKWLPLVVGSGAASLPQALTGLEMAFLLCSGLAAVAAGSRLARVLASLGLLEFMAVDNSYGQITHYWHAWFLSSLVLILLPRGWQNAEHDLDRLRQVLFVLWGAQAMVLLSYSMSGLWKLVFGLGQLSFGLANTFSPTALARHTIEQFLESGAMGVLGPWLIAHPWAGWPLFLGALYLELFAFYAAFRPSLLLPWGLGLIIFHTMVYLTMAINFSYAALLLVILVVSSPFRPLHVRWFAVAADLPLFGWCWTRVRRAHAAPRPSLVPAG